MVWGNQNTTLPVVYFRLTNVTGVTSKSKHSEISRFAICNEAYPTQWRVTYQSFRKIWLVAMTTLILMKITNSKKRTVLNVIRRLKQVVPHPNSIYYEKEILTVLSVIWICLKKEAELLDSRLKGRNLLHQDTEIYFFRKRQNEFKELFSQENDLVFCNDVCSVIVALGHQHDPTEWRLFIYSES
jgi:hypothetical protein